MRLVDEGRVRRIVCRPARRPDAEAGPHLRLVHEPTLPAALPFHELGKVLMTPHVSGWTEGMLEARATLVAGDIERTARGEPPINAIDRGQPR